MINYWKIGIIALIATAIFGSGWWTGHQKYVTYKAEVEAIVKTQEAKVESIKKQQELVTKGITDEYNAKINYLRQYYANGLRQSSSGQMSSNGNSSFSSNDFSPNVILARCAETTQQLVSLQAWINEQLGIK